MLRIFPNKISFVLSSITFSAPTPNTTCFPELIFTFTVKLFLHANFCLPIASPGFWHGREVAHPAGWSGELEEYSIGAVYRYPQIG